MSRRLTIALVCAAGTAHGQPAADAPPSDEPLPDQSIAAAIGIASGGRVTPGGLRVTGHYLYQLSSSDWFDGTADRKSVV